MQDGKKISCWLSCKLTDDEILVAARSMAERLSAVDELEATLASAKKQAGADIDACNAQVGKFRSMVSSGTEHRNVTCSVIYDWPHGKKIIVRDDTEEVVREETVSESERQQNLLDVETEQPVDEPVAEEQANG